MLFLDGVGLGENDPATNPFAAAHLPTLHHLSGGHRWLRENGTIVSDNISFSPTDACLGMPGRPQSGTGQATILTGRNVPALIGRHYGPKPDSVTREILEHDNFFMQANTSALLEAYPPDWHKGINSGKRLPASYQYAARAAGLPFLTEVELRAGQALSGDWTGEAWRDRMGYNDTPVISLYEAGVRLVELSRRYSFSFFPYWLSDVVGHRGDMAEAIHLLERFDQVMAGVLDHWRDDEGLVIITSDHGNMEAMDHRKHTENPVPTVVIGNGHFTVNTLADIAPRMAAALSR